MSKKIIKISVFVLFFGFILLLVSICMNGLMNYPFIPFINN